MISFTLNGNPIEVDVPGDTPLLWVVREHLQMTGSKFGCGLGLCGACSMMLDGKSVRTCILPVQNVANRNITTIEGVGNPELLSTLQQAWVDASVPQCGYCQSGQIISATALLNKNPNPSDSDIDAAMSGNICRCGTYPTIKKAIKSAAQNLRAEQTQTSNSVVQHFNPQTDSKEATA